MAAQVRADDRAPASGVAGPAAPEPRPELPGPRYLLRYKFEPGETIRWKVEHKAEVRTTVNGVTQTAETQSNSVKVWRVTSVDEAKQQAKFIHSVESVDMRQVLSGRQEVRYNSQTDATPPPGFENVAKDVGVPLSEFTIDLRGYVLLRDEKRQGVRPSHGEITVPLADHEVAVGEVWSQPNVVTVKYKDGSPKQIKTRQDYKLVEVDKGIATIVLETTIVTPNNDPTIDAQLIQQVVDGRIRFDIEAGRVISQQTDIDKHVIGFQGDSSSLNYVTRFNEVLTNEEGTALGAKTPSGPKPAPSGPQPPPTTNSAQASGKPSAGAPASGKQSAVKPTTPGKAPAAQTARGPASKQNSSGPAKQPSAAAKSNAPAKSAPPSKTARRNPPAASAPATNKPSPPPQPQPPSPANEIPADEPDPDA
jgi:hypothetical protein